MFSAQPHFRSLCIFKKGCCCCTFARKNTIKLLQTVLPVQKHQYTCKNNFRDFLLFNLLLLIAIFYNSTCSCFWLVFIIQPAFVYGSFLLFNLLLFMAHFYIQSAFVYGSFLLFNLLEFMAHFIIQSACTNERKSICSLNN